MESTAIEPTLISKSKAKSATRRILIYPACGTPDGAWGWVQAIGGVALLITLAEVLRWLAR